MTAMRFEKSGFLKLCRSMMKLDFSDLLYRVSAQTLIICREKDFANRGASEKLADLIRNYKIEMLGGAGHEANTEVPDALAKIIGGFYYREYLEEKGDQIKVKLQFKKEQ